MFTRYNHTYSAKNYFHSSLYKNITVKNEFKNQFTKSFTFSSNICYFLRQNFNIFCLYWYIQNCHQMLHMMQQSNRKFIFGPLFIKPNSLFLENKYVVIFKIYKYCYFIYFFVLEKLSQAYFEQFILRRKKEI